MEREKLNVLAEKTNLSKRRIVLVFERALDLQTAYPYFEIALHEGREMTLYFAPNFLLSKLYSVMLEESMPFQILDRLFSDKYVSLEETANNIMSAIARFKENSRRSWISLKIIIFR